MDLAAIWRNQRSIVKRAARHGCKVAATTEVETRFLRCGLTKEVNRPDRRPNGGRRSEIRAVRHGSWQCRLGPS